MRSVSLALTLLLASCSRPTIPEGRFACDTNADCPPGLTCADDGLCRRSEPRDSGIDGDAGDARTDSSADARDDARDSDVTPDVVEMDAREDATDPDVGTDASDRDGDSDTGTDAGDADADSDASSCAMTECDGECIDTAANPLHCGRCGMACPTIADGEPVCVDSMCGFECDPGRHLCDAQCVPDDSVASCGASCSPCPARNNAIASCDGTSCQYACQPGYDECDGNPANGCESITVASRCGSCGNACSGGMPVCDAASGMATCVSGCSGSLTLCGTSCRDTTTDPAGCGASCTACAIPESGSATCGMGVCGIECNSGYHVCGATCVSDAAVATCGTRCSPCTAPPNAVATCDGTSCGFNCDAGYYASAGTCVAVPAPRLVWPMSTSVVTSSTPLFEWALTSPADGGQIEICTDAACGTVVATTGAIGTTASPPSLPPGRYFWRARGGIGGNYGLSWSEPWSFTLFRSAPATLGPATGTAYGSTLDLRRDGYDDVVIGRNLVDEAYVYFGSASGLPTISSAMLASPDAGAGRYGISVASAGDVNGDGYGDLVVGACGPDTASGDAPVVATCTNNAYVYHGGPAAPGALATRLQPPTGTAALSGFGYSVASAGDVNRDGYGDVVVGAYWIERAYVYLGSAAGLASTASATLAPTAGADGQFGLSVASGDVNGDGYSDVLIGRPEAANPRVFVYCGSPTGTATSTCGALPGPDGSQFGDSVSTGDYNGDGIPDVVAGGRSGIGIVRVFYGNAGPLDLAHDVVWNGGAFSQFGASVSALGDFNGDGRSDVIIGATLSGRTHIYLGGTASGDAAWTSLAPGASAFGRQVSYAGLVDDDAYADFVVGSCDPNTTCNNRVWSWSGGTTAPTTPATWSVLGADGFGLGANR